MRNQLWRAALAVSFVVFAVTLFAIPFTDRAAQQRWLDTQDRFVEVPATLTGVTVSPAEPTGSIDVFGNEVTRAATYAVAHVDGYPATSVQIPTAGVTEGSTRNVWVDTVGRTVVTSGGVPVEPDAPRDATRPPLWHVAAVLAAAAAAGVSLRWMCRADRRSNTERVAAAA